MTEEERPPAVCGDPEPSSGRTTPFIEKHGITPFVFGFVSLILIFFLYQIVGGVITLAIYGIKPAEVNISGYRLATGIGQIVFILAPTFLLVRLVTSETGEYLRFKMPGVPAVALSFAGIYSLQQMLQVFLVFQDNLPLPGEFRSIMQKFKEIFEELYKQLVVTHSLSELIFVLIVIALIPALAEELMFRGLIQRCFERALTPLRGVFFTGIIFGAYHLNPFSFIPLAVIGIYLGFLTMRSGSVWVSVSAHFFNNALAVLALHESIGGDNIVFGDADGMSYQEMLLSFWFFGLVFIISTLYFIKVTKSVQEHKNDRQNVAQNS